MSREKRQRARLLGRVGSGAGRGKQFTQLEWARSQFVEKLGIDPYPGTINLTVDDPESLRVWERLKETSGVRIDNPNPGPNDCGARCYRVSIDGQIDAAIVLPEVSGYSPDKVEIIAAMSVRETLAVSDGDSLSLELR